MVPDVEKFQSALHSILSDEKPDGIRRFGLKVALSDIQNLVEKASYMKA